jgi:ligand-binding sensor domain-containing protein
VGALAAVPGEIWVATDGDMRGGRATLTLMEESLCRTTWISGHEVFGFGAEAVRRIVPGDRVLWLATDRGVVRWSLDDSTTTRWDETRGLQDQRVITALWWQEGLMVGTARGLARIDRLEEVSRPATNLVDPVYALHASRDTLWIGAARGLAMLVAGDSVARIPPRWREQLTSRAEVLGLGTVGDTLVAMHRDGLVWRDPLSGEWIDGAPFGATTGVLRAFHATPDGVWVGGDRGAVLTSAGGNVLYVLRVGLDLPDLVTAITTTDQYLWVGTAQGLVRLTLRDR